MRLIKRFLKRLLAPDIRAIVLILVGMIAVLIVCLIFLGKLQEAIEALVALALLALACYHQGSQRKEHNRGQE